MTKAASSEELTRACLARIEAEDPTIHAFICVDGQGALEAARASDARRARGAAIGPLDGVPLAIKDNLLTAGLVTTAASRMLRNFTPHLDATVIARLRAAGAVLIGKTNLDEFAMGSSTENSSLFPTRNPVDSTRIPGGSSGGSAAAVARGFAYAALGSDTGGSLRQPAALCGVVGLKPTWGRVSRSGLIAFASSLDVVGPLARTAEDAALVLAAIAGFDEADATSSREAVPDYAGHVHAGVRGLRIGVPREYAEAAVDDEVRLAIEEVARALESQGAVVSEVSLPHTKFAMPAYYVVSSAEASSNLSRFDGVRFGLGAEGSTRWNEGVAQVRSRGFGNEVKRRIMLGTFALSRGYYDAYYLQAQKVRTLVRQDFRRLFEAGTDVILSATSPVPAWKLGEKLESPVAMYAMDVLTIPASLAGLPAISAPARPTNSGLPVGFQLIGKAFDEATLLAVVQAWQTHVGSAGN